VRAGGHTLKTGGDTKSISVNGNAVFLLFEGAKELSLQRWGAIKKGSGTEGTYSIKI